ncbi:hypothetical protein [Enterovirga sp.]|uniref:hypothetical protein n=1 Tax=Enterovirga sp. TaxID=2026350 RepID=UPI002BCE6756|nr:hypothetical protein [Enterovirga sp.]HMO30874.1 hypothetical protein [Enterovirga sp.]
MSFEIGTRVERREQRDVTGATILAQDEGGYVLIAYDEGGEGWWPPDALDLAPSE